MTLDEAIKNHIVQSERALHDIEYYTTQNDMEWLDDCKKEYEQFAEEERQLAEWLKKLQRYEFEISECKAILDNPTPDVTENDRKRAMYVLQTFPDVGGKR